MTSVMVLPIIRRKWKIHLDVPLCTHLPACRQTINMSVKVENCPVGTHSSLSVTSEAEMLGCFAVYHVKSYSSVLI